MSQVIRKAVRRRDEGITRGSYHSTVDGEGVLTVILHALGNLKLQPEHGAGDRTCSIALGE